MDSLGKFLRETRLNLNISLGQIAKDTNIAKKYLEAIENEEYSIFPGDTYLKGFLRSYCEYLKLDPNEIISKYERIKIAESPIPMDKLIPKPKINFRPVIVISIMLIILTGIIYGSFRLYSNYLSQGKNPIAMKKKVKKAEKKKKKEEAESNKYKLTEEDKEKVFNLKKGDRVEIIKGSEKMYLQIKELSPIVIVNDNMDNEIFLIKSYNHKIDLNHDNKYDVVLNLNFWDSETANITMRPFVHDGTFAEENDVENLTGQNPETIFKTEQLEDIQFSLNIEDPTFLKYKIDNEDDVEKFYNQRINNNISAKKRVIVWLSNAGAVTFNFNKYNKTYSPGNLGEVSVKVIQWLELATGEYELQISSLN